ncbi:ATP-dependent RNA helicase [Phytophthora fragariae]|uniref:RNA helicase n=1 Tax=Phytophthora fragariae TaxID=53985 RepID=A0A6A3RBE6_9STRA|nr:ATP-dependent RNA helicase [Phytophthora fragariae]KAE8930893.1 ATP-dependent RNA helicase [Phytophthora fragariae]KAE8988665.1 ATP-dependent RNA helicase [Phytophthora fragariae]KAE9094020.1 ATP-dependent RNA helicase [Phytophthora fragariae]KAE9094144.1 ATP-dependent RNA helicase [Phytophthora fragariae]
MLRAARQLSRAASRPLRVRQAPLQLLAAAASPLRSAHVLRPPLSSRVPLYALQTRNLSESAALALDAAEQQRITWPQDVARRVHRRMRSFPRNYEAKELAVKAGLNPAEWALAASSFRKSFLSEPSKYFDDPEELTAFARDLDDVKRHSSFIFYPYFLDYAKANHYMSTDEENDSALSLQQLTDLRLPHEMYPYATALKRKIIYHEGPTNSGKTHQALERLKQAGEDGGIYCGPLRLLALEIYERLNTDGLYTSLVTGQEKKIIPYSSHVSCTVEMANINRPWDVAVIDEIQLIGDPQRGWAWTRALFGLQAREVHVCGSGEAVHLVKKFAETTGDDFELRSYERRSPLEISTTHLKNYSNIRPGDCVVAFSRRDIFQIKRDIEIKTGQKCCIIYGQLPPETRSQQARLFNDRNNDFNILVASDAVGMGLNLNIRRVVFATVKKYSGGSSGMVDIPAALAKQIAGRAGRYGSDFASGEATCLLEEDLEYLEESYAEVPTPLTSAGLFPSSEQMEEFAKQLPGISDLADLVDKYVMLARLDGDYFMCNHQDMKDAATLLRDTELTLSDRFTFCMSPVSLRNPLARKVFLEYARAHSLGQSVKLDIYLPKYPPRTAEALGDVEIKAKIIDLYLWLSFRFEETFVEKDLAMELKVRVLELVEQGLVNTTYNREEKKTRWGSGVGYGRRSTHLDRFRDRNNGSNGKQDRRSTQREEEAQCDTKTTQDASGVA